MISWPKFVAVYKISCFRERKHPVGKKKVFVSFPSVPPPPGAYNMHPLSWEAAANNMHSLSRGREQILSLRGRGGKAQTKKITVIHKAPRVQARRSTLNSTAKLKKFECICRQLLGDSVDLEGKQSCSR